jgi:CspA family cold shock protein
LEVKVISVPQGTIKKLVADRGFGFIAAEDGVEYFFHRSALDRALDFDSLRGSERVQFDIEPSQRGPRATRVRPA